MAVIDVHSHLYPEWYLEFFKGRTRTPRVVEEEDGSRRFLLFDVGDGTSVGPIMLPEFTSPMAKLEFMDANGIDCSIISLGNPWLDVFEPETSLGMAREANARLGQCWRESRGRLLAMGVLPRAKPDKIAEVVEEIAGHEGLRGVISGPMVGGLLLDDRELRPVWEALSRHRTPLMIHPLIPQPSKELQGYQMAVATGVAFPFVTSIAITRLVLGGVFESHPDLLVVGTHGGGALPFLVSRIDGAISDDHTRRIWREGIRRLLLDAVLYDPSAVRLAADLVGSDQLLFGTDHPFQSNCLQIQKSVRSALSEDESERVLGGGARHWYSVPPRPVEGVE